MLLSTVSTSSFTEPVEVSIFNSISQRQAGVTNLHQRILARFTPLPPSAASHKTGIPAHWRSPYREYSWYSVALVSHIYFR